MATSYEIVIGAATSPVMLHVPHSSTAIPTWVRDRIVLDDDELDRELVAMTDAHTDLIAAVAAHAAVQRPWQFVNWLSRLVIDPERFTEPGAEEMEAVGMGAVYTATHDRKGLRREDREHRRELLSRFFEPYAEALADVVDERLRTTGRAVVIDVHSFPKAALPYELHPDLDHGVATARRRPASRLPGSFPLPRLPLRTVVDQVLCCEHNRQTRRSPTLTPARSSSSARNR
jgi:predicted N-formylglutamate amidohydrolase